MSQRFIPHTSDMSIGATFPRKIEARNEETRDMRDVFWYSLGCLVLKRSICGPVNRYRTERQLHNIKLEDSSIGVHFKSFLSTRRRFVYSVIREMTRLGLLQQHRVSGIEVRFKENTSHMVGFASRIDGQFGFVPEMMVK